MDGAEPDDGGGWLLPAKAAPPAWFDGALRQRLEAGEAVPLETIRGEAGAGEAADVPGVPKTHEVDRPARPAPVGIRPGIGIGVRPFCTTAFLYENVTNGDLAIATAGHCVSEGQEVDALVVQEEPRPSVRMLRPMGTVVHSVFGPDVPDDAALVDIRDRHEDLANPRMAGWGGPCGARTSYSPGDTVVKWGQGTDPILGSPRSGVVSGPDARLLRWTGVQIPGDSGAGVRFATTGLAHEEAGAAGIATRFDTNPFTPWTANGPDTEYVQELFPDQWQLVSSPDCPPGPT